MKSEVLLAIVLKRLGEIQPEVVRGLRGFRGADGLDFDFESHSESIRNIIKEESLTFDKLTDEERESLRGHPGPKGDKGDRGEDGKDFDLDSNLDLIRNIIKEESLTFDKLTDEERDSLRGSRGLKGDKGDRGEDGSKGDPGKDGKDFDLESNLSLIQDLVKEESLTFDKLTDEERESLRGPRGLKGDKGDRGSDGKDFIFSEHIEYFETLRPKFQDFTEEDISRIRGPRGQRGKQGKDGRDGVDGKDGVGIRGLPGLTGVKGDKGDKGDDGKDGIDAPVIEKIEAVQSSKKEFELDFSFSDGTRLRTNSVSLPSQGVSQVLIPIVQSGGGGSGTNVEGFWLKSLTAYDKTLSCDYADSGLRFERIVGVNLASSSVPDANARIDIEWLDVGRMTQRISKKTLTGTAFGAGSLEQEFNYFFDGLRYRFLNYSYSEVI